jgi:hypothetical protein
MTLPAQLQPAPLEPYATQAQTQTGDDQLTLLQIVAILAAGLAVKATLDRLASILLPLGISRSALQAAWIGGRFGHNTRTRLDVTVRTTVTGGTRSPALAATLAGEPAYRAAFLLNSARRVQNAVDAARLNGQDEAQARIDAATTERRHAAAHEAAVENRRRAAQAVDAAARNGGRMGTDANGLPAMLVGWYSRHDSKVSPECLAADGTVFPVNRPPAIGWPGAVHPHCRCRPGPARPFARFTDDATAGMRH